MVVLLLVCCDNTACSMVVWGCDEKPEDDVTWFGLLAITCCKARGVGDHVSYPGRSMSTMYMLYMIIFES
jgi:hypothetical protein